MQMTIDFRAGAPIVGAVTGNRLVRAAAAAFRSWRIEARDRRAFNAMGNRADIGLASGDLRHTLARTSMREGWIDATATFFNTRVPPASNDDGAPSPELRRHRL